MQSSVSSNVLVEYYHRRIVQSIATWILILAGIAVLVAIVSFIFNQNPVIWQIVILATIVAVGCGLTLWLLANHRSLPQALAPFIGSILLTQFAVAIWLPDIVATALPFLTVIVLLAGLSGQRIFTISTLLICIAIVATILAFTTENEQTNLPQHLLRFVDASNIVALLLAAWSFLDQTVVAQQRALQLADQRAREADTARQVAETARLEVEQRATEQQRLLDLVAVLELPILQIDDQVLLAPLVGHLDSRRAEQLRSRILAMVADKRAHTVIIDITGITLIDTAVAKALIDTAAAVRLLGARTIISGIRPAVAQTLVHLNTGLGEITTAPNPEAALALARRTAMA